MPPRQFDDFPPPLRHPRPPRHHHERLLDALNLLIDAGFIHTVADLANAADRFGAVEAATFLRDNSNVELPPGLVLEKLRVFLNEDAYRRLHKLLGQYSDKKVGLVLPLPPHVLDQFITLQQAEILNPGDHHLPPHFYRANLTILDDVRKCREEVGVLDMIVFEVCRANGNFLADASTSDLLHPHLLKVNVELVAHIRPHPHPTDVLLHAEMIGRVVLL